MTPLAYGLLLAVAMPSAAGRRISVDTLLEANLDLDAARTGPPQCPVEVPESSGGDPADKLCCKSGASMFTLTGLKIQVPNLPASDMTTWMGGCDACKDTEARLEVMDPEVKFFEKAAPLNNGAGSFTRYRLTTYADLNPLSPDRPLYVDGKFNPDHQYVLFLYATEDHNGAFGFTNMLCKRLKCWRERGFEVVLRRVGTKKAAKDVLDAFHDDSIHHVVLSGHGSSTTLQWSYAWDGSLGKGDSGTESFLFKLREKIKIDGTVTLDACNNAEDRLMGLQNLYEYIASKLPGRQITASQVSLSDSMWTQVQETGELPAPRDAVLEDATLEFDDHCVAGDRVKFLKDGENVTSIRFAGRPNCKELKKDQIPLFGECLSRCRSTCDSVWTKDWNKDGRKDVTVTLQPDLAATEEIVKLDLNPCWFGKKTVCKIVDSLGRSAGD